MASGGSESPAQPPFGAGPDAAIEYLTRPFPKDRFLDPRAAPPQDLLQLVETVQPARIVARIRPPAPAGALPGGLKLGDGARVVGREVLAVVQGALTVGEGKLDVIPFYVVAGDAAPSQDIAFFGNVLVAGDVREGATLQAEDVYVAGNAQAATITAKGDVWVGGEIAGMGQGTVEAHGRVFARSISNATVQGLGDILVRDAITYSEVTSNSRVIVAAERGAMVGGTVSALRGIVARNIGSDFGALTQMTVGRDFLTVQRLMGLEQRIKAHEEGLARIAELKRQIGVETASFMKIPREKQDLYISLLQKEDKIGEELMSLRRGKERFDQAMKEFLQASIQVLEKLHPPVQIQIGQAIETIRERLEGVVLVLGQDNKIAVRREDPHGRQGTP